MLLYPPWNNHGSTDLEILVIVNYSSRICICPFYIPFGAGICIIQALKIRLYGYMDTNMINEGWERQLAYYAGRPYILLSVYSTGICKLLYIVFVSMYSYNLIVTTTCICWPCSRLAYASCFYNKIVSIFGHNTINKWKRDEVIKKFLSKINR